MCKYYIGYSENSLTRYEASSGGIGSAIIQYLLSGHDYDTSISFFFNEKECKYEPKLIHSFQDYYNCGSIYQDVDLIGFIKDNINEIGKGLVVTCLPCQVRAIKRIVTSAKLRCFIICLCCSGQTTLEGTYYYYRLLHIDKKDVKHIRYRGEGWPSGIKILLKDGRIIKKDNYTYPWSLIHKSFLFRPKRCLLCPMKTNNEADVALADPWLKEYIKNDKKGNTMTIAYSSIGIDVLESLWEKNMVTFIETNEQTYIKSQLGTIEWKANVRNHKRFFHLIRMMSTTYYKKIATSSVFCLKMHNRIIKYLYKLL